MTSPTANHIHVDLPEDVVFPKLTLARVTAHARLALSNARKIREPDLVVVVLEGPGFKKASSVMVADCGTCCDSAKACAALAILDNIMGEDPRVQVAKLALREFAKSLMGGRG